MPAPLDITLLQAFAAVVDAGGFTRAARQLNRTQSAVSTQVRKLESAAGRQLLERDGRRARLTEDGELLLDYARRILHLHEEALGALNTPAMEGLVRLGVPDDYAHHFLPDVLSRFARTHPRVRVEVIGDLSGPLLDQFEAGALDAAVITKQPHRSAGDIIRREPLVWTAAADHIAHLRDPIPLAVFPEGCVFRACALSALNVAGRSWVIAYSSQSFAGGDIAVEGGHAVTMMFRSMVPSRWRILGPREGFPELPDVEMELCRSARGTNTAADALTDELAEVLPNL